MARSASDDTPTTARFSGRQIAALVAAVLIGLLLRPAVVMATGALSNAAITDASTGLTANVTSTGRLQTDETPSHPFNSYVMAPVYGNGQLVHASYTPQTALRSIVAANVYQVPVGLMYGAVPRDCEGNSFPYVQLGFFMVPANDSRTVTFPTPVVQGGAGVCSVGIYVNTWSYSYPLWVTMTGYDIPAPAYPQSAADATSAKASSASNARSAAPAAATTQAAFPETMAVTADSKLGAPPQ